MKEKKYIYIAKQYRKIMLPTWLKIQTPLGTIHLRCRHVLGGEGSKIYQICRRIVKTADGRGQKFVKICRRLKWIVPSLISAYRSLAIKVQRADLTCDIIRNSLCLC